MPVDPYAVLRALVRAEASRNAPKPQVQQEKRPQPSPQEQRAR